MDENRIMEEVFENTFKGRKIKEVNYVSTKKGHYLEFLLSREGRPDIKFTAHDYKFNTLLEE